MALFLGVIVSELARYVLPQNSSYLERAQIGVDQEFHRFAHLMSFTTRIMETASAISPRR